MAIPKGAGGGSEATLTFEEVKSLSSSPTLNEPTSSSSNETANRISEKLATELIYPETFFNIPHPSNPVAYVQFRTGKAMDIKSINDPTIWTNIVSHPNNYFDSLSLEDEGGANKLSLTLVDPNHSFLEDMILRMTSVLNIENALSTEKPKDVGLKHSVQDKSFFIESVATIRASIRIRIGYSDATKKSEYFNEPDSYDFLNRVDDSNKDKPVTMTPWLYYVITNIDINLTQRGLEVTIEAVNESAPVLYSFKTVGNSARISGTPKYVLNVIYSLASAVMNTELDPKTGIKDDPIIPLNDDKEYLIHLPVGFMNSNGEFQFSTMSKIFDDFCALVTPAYVDSKGNYATDLVTYEDVEGEAENSNTVYNYTWQLIDNGDTKDLLFFYRHPKKEQKFVRSYAWYEYAHSVIKDISIKSDYMFSQLNLPLFKTDDNGDHKFYVMASNEDGRVGVNDLSSLLDSSEFAFTFAADTFDDNFYKIEGKNKDPGITEITRLSGNLNQMLHKGTITIQGDPFYLFDKVMNPFRYTINIIIRKPTYIDEDGIMRGGGRSYLSGEYVITKITHNLSAGDYTTTLDIQRAL